MIIIQFTIPPGNTSFGAANRLSVTASTEEEAYYTAARRFGVSEETVRTLVISIEQVSDFQLQVSVFRIPRPRSNSKHKDHAARAKALGIR